MLFEFVFSTSKNQYITHDYLSERMTQYYKIKVRLDRLSQLVRVGN